jgi:hypothetical protein
MEVKHVPNRVEVNVDVNPEAGGIDHVGRRLQSFQIRIGDGTVKSNNCVSGFVCSSHQQASCSCHPWASRLTVKTLHLPEFKVKPQIRYVVANERTFP